MHNNASKPVFLHFLKNQAQYRKNMAVEIFCLKLNAKMISCNFSYLPGDFINGEGNEITFLTTTILAQTV